ncbi:MAG: Spy/CpxP family protein refolding chaperone [Fimbriimonadales bacterium]|nr:Spy/CpxP family protein refolding chaperone [Fimbriimonadales bacterium]
MLRSLFVLLALLAALAVASAQREAPPPIERIGLTLLTSPEIRSELKLSKEVSSQVEAEFKSYVEKAQSLFAGKNTPAEQQGALRELRKVQDATAARILARLTPNQRTRLRQLTLQSQSVLLILHPEVVRELKLTPQQQERLRSIRASAEAKVRELETRRRAQLDAVPKPKQGASKKDVEDYNQRIQREIQTFAAADQRQIRTWSQATERDSLAVLNPAQRRKWDELLGPKFRRPGQQP